jgi:uncharacterized protein with FMN-binding domain
MKRVLLSIVGTIVGLVALLSFKSQGTVAISGSALPSAGVSSSAAAGNPSTSSQATSAPPNPTASSSATSGTTTSKSTVGTAIQTRYGIVQVKVVTSGHSITSVSFVQLTAFDHRSQQINSGAAPTLLNQTLKAQSAKIDGVSGATYTTDGYRQSLQSALDKAGF